MVQDFTQLQRRTEDVYAEWLIREFDAAPGQITSRPVPFVYAILDELEGTYFVRPWGWRINTPFRRRGYVVNLGYVHDSLEVKDVVFKQELEDTTDEGRSRGVPGIIKVDMFYGLALSDGIKAMIYEGKKGVLTENTYIKRGEKYLTVEDLVINTIIKFRESHGGYSEAVAGLRTDISNAVRRIANANTLEYAMQNLRVDCKNELDKSLNADFERRWNLNVARIAVEPNYSPEIFQEIKQAQSIIERAGARRRSAQLQAGANRTILQSLRDAGLEGSELGQVYAAIIHAQAQVDVSENLAGSKVPLIVQLPSSQQRG